MKKLYCTITFVMCLVASAVLAQGPNNSGVYYQQANGKKGAALKTAFFNIIKNPDVVSYNGLIEAYHKTDTRPDGYIRDWYSNSTSYTWNDRNGNSREGAGWNREHSVPQSWFSKSSPMVSDIVHVLPTDCYVNNRRSSYPFGEVESTTYVSNNGYSKLGSCKTAGYSGTVFEPNDEIKGDIARIYFYMVTCYEDRFTNWSAGSATQVFSSDKYQGLKTWCMDMMMRWSKQDPVDATEIARNNAVQEVQGNRNPFVDYPGLEQYVWGDKKDVAFSYDNYGGVVIPDPDEVATPVFLLEPGTYKEPVNVKLSCSTPGASIYYKTDLTAVVPSIHNTLYTDDGIDVSTTTTIQAIAYLNGKYSPMATATYVINAGGGHTDSTTTEIALNNAFFDVNWNGSRPAGGEDVLTGRENGITITYSKGSSGNMYCNGEQIRLYGGNELKVESSVGEMVKLEFVTKDSSKELLLQSGGGAIDGYTWNGLADGVTFGAESGSGHIKMLSVKVTLAIYDPTGIANVVPSAPNSTAIYDLQGRRVLNPKKGLYIVNGRKINMK